MLAVIGLGNPGRKYHGTRHNIGFDVVDHVAEKLSCNFHPGHGEFEIASGVFQEKEFILIKPQTWMNNSGIAVKEVAEQCTVALENLLVVSDDFQLPLGTLRLRRKGSDGGHNGLGSIIYHLQSTMFLRLRCGIAGKTIPVHKENLKEYVLSRFEKDEKNDVHNLIVTAADCITMIITEGVIETQNRFHIKKV